MITSRTVIVSSKSRRCTEHDLEHPEGKCDRVEDMNTYTIVRPEHLNHHGYLFGGQLLKWVDEYAWLTAARDFPGYYLVTRAMDKIDFKTRVMNGSILRFHILPWRKGNTSITYRVEVFADEPGASVGKKVFSTHVTFVSVNERGEKSSLPKKSSLRSELKGTDQ
jgi:acyl-CoA hydrolase